MPKTVESITKALDGTIRSITMTRNASGGVNVSVELVETEFVDDSPVSNRLVMFETNSLENADLQKVFDEVEQRLKAAHYT